MKTLFKKITSKAALITALLAIIASSASALSSDISNFAQADRGTILYSDGVAGLNYPSFNNFTNNPNIGGGDNIPDPQNGDERLFMIGKYCEGGNCPTTQQCENNSNLDGCFSNTAPITAGKKIKANDTVRFELYFHNNAKDPHDGITEDEEPVENAKNVKIGVDLNSTSTLIEGETILRPNGFIYADNTSYKTNPRANTGTIFHSTLTSGFLRQIDSQFVRGISDLEATTIRSISDDMQLIMLNNNITLNPQIRQNLTPRLYLKTIDRPGEDKDVYFDQTLSTTWTNITFESYDANNTLIGSKSTVQARYVTEGDKIWIEFSELPGCFRYSGFVYFEALAVEELPPVCESLEIRQMNKTSININGIVRDTTVLLTRLTWENGAIPENTQIRWGSTDVNGKFYFRNADGSFGPNEATATNTITRDYRVEVFYVGSGTVSAGVASDGSNPRGERLNPNTCRDEFPIIDIPEICEELNINYQDPIYAGTVSTFSADANFTNNTDYPIVYSVEPGYGMFYKDPADIPSNIPVNDSPTNFESSTNGDKAAIKLLQNSRIKASTLITELDAEGTSSEEIAQRIATKDSIALSEAIARGDKATIIRILSGASYSDAQIKEVLNTGSINTLGATVFTSSQYGYGDDVNNTPESNNSNPSTTPVTPTIRSSAIPEAATISTPSTPTIPTGLDSSILSRPEIIQPSTAATTVPDDENGRAVPTVSTESTVPTLPSSALIDPVRAEVISTGTQTTSPVTTGADSGTTITVNPGETVYFVAYKGSDGEDVITVSIAGYTGNDPNCEDRFFPIVEEEFICTALDLNVRQNSANGAEVSSLEPGSLYFLTAQSTFDPEGNTNASTSFTTSKAGVYLPANVNPAILQSIRIGALTAEEIERLPRGQDPSTIATKVPDGSGVYFVTYSNLPGNVAQAIKANTVGSNNLSCSTNVPLVMDDLPICQGLTFTVRADSSNGVITTTLSPNSIYSVSADADYSDAEFRNTVTFRSRYGSFIADNARGRALLEEFRTSDLSLEQFNLELALRGERALPGDIEVAENTPVFFITRSNIDTAVDTAISVNATNFKNLECTDSAPLNPSAGICENLNLQPREIPFDPLNEQTIDITGEFENHEGEVRVVVTGEAQISRNNENDFGSTITFSAAEVENSNNRLRFQYSPTDDFDPTRDTIRLTAVAVGAESTCRDELSTEAVLTCEDLEITRPGSPWKVSADPDENPAQKIEIAVNTSPNNLEEDLYYHWIVTEGPGEWENGDKEDVTQDLENTLEGYTQNTRVRVFATFDEDDDSPIRIGGRASCLDEIRAQGDEEPEIEKLVYTEGDFEDASEILNIGEGDESVTYGVIFTPGNQVNSARIRETSMDNGRIEGNRGGYLEFTGMRINIIDGDERYAILQSEDYNPEEDGNANEEFSDENFDTNGNSSVSDYESDYSCDNRDNDICLEGDFDQAIEDFQNGDPLNFRNLSQGSDIKIIIKYQMANNSAIDEESCKDISSANGCGEQFENVIEFEAYPGNEFEEEGEPSDCEERDYCEDIDDSVCEEDTVTEYCDDRYEDQDDIDNCEDQLTNFCDDRETDICEDNEVAEKYCDELYPNSTSNYEDCLDSVENFCDDNTTDSDSGDIICNEDVINDEYCEDTPPELDTVFRGEDDARVIVVCPYILLRTGGDSFFRSAVDVGVDIAQCSEVKSTPGVIIREVIQRPQSVVKTGTSEDLTLTRQSNAICSTSNISDESSIEGYDNVLKNFSSTVCELAAEVSQSWTEENISNAISANITRLARFGANLNNVSQLNSMTSLVGINNAQSGVYIKDNGPLTINLGDQRIQQNGDIPATQTYIVIGHDLIINSDIRYGTTDYSTPNSIPSAAFIVIDGNIVINNEVGYIDGVVMAVSIDKEDAGKITNSPSGDISKQILTINGSLIGNVVELFKSRQGVGDPTKDEGSVTIRYDQRILVNPPAGLSELIDVSQLRGI